jgi:hypothetical protein
MGLAKMGEGQKTGLFFSVGQMIVFWVDKQLVHFDVKMSQGPKGFGTQSS